METLFILCLSLSAARFWKNNSMSSYLTTSSLFYFPLSRFIISLDRHVQSHHGHHKPFRCKLCPFKSAYVSRLKSHLHKAHTGKSHRDDQGYQEGSLYTYMSSSKTVSCLPCTQKLMSVVFFFLSGEQHTYKCLSCPFSSMTISQLKEHSLRDHGEALTLQKLRAATQASHSTSRPLRLTGATEPAPITPNGNKNNNNNSLS